MIEVTVPKWGLTMEEATIVSWKKSAGEAVQEGEVLVELETDKTTGEVEAPISGILGEVVHEEGDTVEVEQVIARIFTIDEWNERQ